jgi:esterase/lipase superfamily enzyme
MPCESLLKAISRDPAVGEISILAHSMGNSLRLETLRQMAIRDGRVTPEDPQRPAGAHRTSMSTSPGGPRRYGAEGEPSAFTLYVSQDDRALAVVAQGVGQRRPSGLPSIPIRSRTGRSSSRRT